MLFIFFYSLLMILNKNTAKAQFVKKNWGCLFSSLNCIICNLFFFSCSVDVGPASMLVGNLVAGKRIAQAIGRELGTVEDQDLIRKVPHCIVSNQRMWRLWTGKWSIILIRLTCSTVNFVRLRIFNKDIDPLKLFWFTFILLLFLLGQFLVFIVNLEGSLEQRNTLLSS